MPLYLFKPLFKLNCINEHWRTQIAIIILPRTSSFAVLGRVLKDVVYVIGAVKLSPWEVCVACERVQYRGEEEAADMATYDAD